MHELIPAGEQRTLRRARLLASQAAVLTFIDLHEDLTMVPKLAHALRSGLPALSDCDHQLFQEHRRQKVQGPCSRGQAPGELEL